MNRPKGTKDIFGDRQLAREYILNILKSFAKTYNFNKISTPTFERKEVFVKSAGETSDIVSKEMYEFEDKKGRKMTLRPEGTAGVIRAIVENKLYARLPLKLFYEGSMFRYENPQQGRQREFTQFGVEIISEKSPFLDAEVITLAYTILKSLKLPFKLVINSIGDKDTKEKYSLALKEYFNKHKDELTNDSINRIESNPMRILDDKIDGAKDVVKKAPIISDFYSVESKKYFDSLLEFLDSMDIKYEVDYRLVRGLDYYTDTAFEFVSTSDRVGSQSTIIGGGRYDNLVKQFGGPELSGVGFGIGVERLVNDFIEMDKMSEIEEDLDVYVLNISEGQEISVSGIVYMLRSCGISTEWNYKPLRIKKAFNKADKSKAKIIVIAGENELKEGNVKVKISGKEKTVDINDLIKYISGVLDENNK